MEYTVGKKSVGIGKQKTVKYVAKLHSRQTLSREVIAQTVAKRTSMEASEVLLALDTMEALIERAFSGGQSIEIPGFGIIRPVLRYKSVDDAENVTADVITKLDAKFYFSKEFSQRIKNVSLTRRKSK